MLIDTRCLTKSLILFIGAMMFGAHAQAEFRFKPYVAVGGAVSILTPDPGTAGLEVTGSNGFGYSAILGVDVSNRFSIEAGLNDLGVAVLTDTAGTESEISYQALSFGLLFHALGDAGDIAARDGGWTYLRLGVNQISNETDLNLDQEDSIAVWGAIGYEWSFSSMFSVRAELATFDTDAYAATAAIVLRPFSHTPVRTAVVVPDAGSAPQAPEPSNASRLAIPGDSGSSNQIAGVQRGLRFIPDSIELTPESSRTITSIAKVMQAAPDVRVEIRAYATSSGGSAAAQSLSKKRAVVVARALVAAGVDVKRLKARAFGDKQPQVVTGSARGETLPDRIELVSQ